MKKKKRINGCLVVALSSSMALTSIASPLQSDASLELDVDKADATPGLESDSKNNNNDNNGNDNKEATIKIATSSNATPEEEEEKDLSDEDFSFEDEDTKETTEEEIKEDEVVEDALEADARDEYPEFATDEFWTWILKATEEELSDWYDTVTIKVATSSDAQKAYPAFDMESDEFMDWFMDYLVKDDGESMEFNYEHVLEYVKNSDFDSAMALLNYIANSKNISLLSAIGNMWPDGYGDNADFLTDGNGTQESPYILNSVDDLRGFASYVAQGQDSSSKYYRIEAGTYDLNGSWIPVGFPLNAGGNYVAFKGHLSAEDGAEIINFGVETNSTLGITGQISSQIKAQENVGFFGYLGAGSSVENLLIETEGNTIEGTTNTGILAGKATDATIKNCTVRGHVKGTRNVGGIVGYIESSSTSAGVRKSVIEDCNAEDVGVYSIKNDGQYGAVGGIAGYAKNTTIADVYVSTNSGAGNHIYETV